MKKVHLIAVSPASTVFRFGQMLQAGHHPEYLVYDREQAGTTTLLLPCRLQATTSQPLMGSTPTPFLSDKPPKRA